MDHMMPEMDGIDTLKAMKAIPDFANANTPIIMLTANAISGVEEEYLGAGFDGYLAKPVKLNLLQDIINKYIKG
jgi:CheY-like chemotaxis protein